jgi:hypothetical protein
MCWFQARLRRSSMDDFVPFVVGTDLHFSLLYSFRGTAGIHSWCLCLHTVCYIYYNLYTIIQYHPFYSVLSGSALQQQSQDNQQAPSLSLLFSWQVQVSDTFGLEEDVLVSIRYGTVRPMRTGARRQPWRQMQQPFGNIQTVKNRGDKKN